MRLLSLLGIFVLMGIEPRDALKFGGVLGTQISINEFVAYIKLGEIRDAISQRSFVMATYAMCGFANFSSSAIQIGGIGSIAPERRKDLARLGLRTMIAGALASYQTATIAGVLLSPEQVASQHAKPPIAIHELQTPAEDRPTPAS